MTTVGEAFIEIKAETRNFARELNRDLARVLRRVDSAEIDFTADLEDVRSDIRDVVNDVQGVDGEFMFEADISDVRSKVSDVEDLVDDVIEVTVDADTSRAESAIKDVDSDVPNIDVQVEADTEPASSAIRSLERDEQGRFIKKEVQIDESGFGGSLRGLASSPAVAAAGAAIGAALAAGIAAAVGIGINNALDQASAQRNTQALLGLSDEEAERVGAIQGRLFADAYGESLEDLSTTTTAVIRGLGEEFNEIDDIRLEGIIATADNIQQAFGVSAEESADAIRGLLTNDLVDSVEEAQDILVRGLQFDASGDFIDTLREYGTEFQQLGITGEGTLNILQGGLEAGARNTDFIADALKEASIRLQETTGPTAEALEELGLNAMEVSSAIAEGGPAAREAFAQVTNELSMVEDATRRNELAIGIYGTKAEDLSSDVLDAIAEQVVGFGEALDSIEDLGGGIDVLSDDSVDALQDLGLNAAAIGDAFNEGGTSAGQSIGTIIKSLSEMDDQQEANRISNQLFGLSVEDVMGDVQADFLAAQQQVEGLDGAAENLDETFNAGIGTTLTSLRRQFEQGLGDLFGPLIEQFNEFLNSEGFQAFIADVQDFFNGIVENEFVIETVQRLSDAWDRLVQVIEDHPEEVQTIVDVLGFLASTALAAGLLALQGAIDFVTNQLDRLFTTVERIRSIVDFFTNFRENAALAGEVVRNRLEQMGDSFNNFVDRVVGFVSGLPGRVLTEVQKLPGIISAQIQGMIDAVSGFAGRLRVAGQDAANDFVNGLIELVQTLPGRMAAFLRMVVQEIRNFGANAAREAASAGRNIANSLSAGLGNVTSNPGSIFAGATGVFFNANGSIVDKPILSVVGEAGAEAIIPLTRPARALELLQESGLDQLLFSSLGAGDISLPGSQGGGLGSSISNNNNSVVNNVEIAVQTQEGQDANLLAQSLLEELGSSNTELAF